jgi:hypothetical protein
VPRPPSSRAASSRWQPGPAYQLRPSRPSLTGASAAEPPLPRRIAINARPTSATTPPLYSSRPLTPRLPEPSQSALAPFPPSWRARRCSSSPPSPSLLRAPIKGPARARLHHTAPAISTAFLPEPIELAPPCSLHRSGELPSPSLAILCPIKLCSKLRHALTVTGRHFPPYCGRQPHRRHHHRGHPPPCRGPAAIGHRRSNSAHPRDPHHPPVLRHHLPAVEPDQRRRTAAGLAAGRTPVELPPLPPLSSTPSATPSPWRVGPAPRRRPRRRPAQLGQLGRKRTRPRALAPAGPKSPPAQLAGNPFSFFFSLFFFPFSHIYLDANILCTKNSLNKL